MGQGRGVKQVIVQIKGCQDGELISQSEGSHTRTEDLDVGEDSDLLGCRDPEVLCLHVAARHVQLWRETLCPTPSRALCDFPLFLGKLN